MRSKIIVILLFIILFISLSFTLISFNKIDVKSKENNIVKNKIKKIETTIKNIKNENKEIEENNNKIETELKDKIEEQNIWLNIKEKINEAL